MYKKTKLTGNVYGSDSVCDSGLEQLKLFFKMLKKQNF